MKIVQLTPGTGNFYCGLCMRDSTLAAALRRLGHDAVIVPMYLPMMIDEPAPAGEAPMFFGGINVYLQQKSALFRHTPAWLDRLLDRPRLLRWAAGRAGLTREEDLGEITLSMLQGEQGRQVKELHKLLAWLSKDEHRPQVVCLSNVMLAGLAGAIRSRLNVPVLCTLHGEDAFLDGLPDPYRERAWSELARRAADVEAFIAVSRYYGEVMRRRLELPPGKVHVVHNGILLDGYAPAAAPPDPPVVGYLARWSPQKGLHTLIEAFVHLRKRGRVAGVRLRVAGTTIPADEPFVSRLRTRLAENGLGSAAEFLPNVSHGDKQEFLRSLSVLSVPATYGEAFGLYCLEAWACGVPVVQPRHGAFPELIEATGGGILCPPDDPQALAESIESLLLDADRMRVLGRRGREAVLERFGVERMAREVLDVCRRAAGVEARA
ncbi:MAG: glycosyltransferase family 4 protein [Phycisphaerae bacterium]|jgi:glycosyltransferase involved in cell wall biosynthesis